jgi:hypothetical protein
MTLGEKEQEFLAALRVSKSDHISSHASSTCRHGHSPRCQPLSQSSSRQLTAAISLQAYYYDEKALLSNEEFDNLKEDLIWAGSKVAVLRYAPSPVTQR